MLDSGQLAKHNKNESWVDLEKKVKKALGAIDESALGKCSKNIHDYDVIIFHVNTILSNLNIENFLGFVIADACASRTRVNTWQWILRHV